MNKAVELFDKIYVDNTEINLQELDNNNGVFNLGQQKQNVNVKFVLKEEVNAIPEKLFAGTSLKEVISIPEVIESIAEDAFEGIDLSQESQEEIDKVKYGVYTEEEANTHNAEIEGAYIYGQLKEDKYINDYDKIEYIYDKDSWDASYANGIMKKYYETYPDEDWYNENAHRPANFNDKAYTVDIYEDENAIYSFESFDSQEKTTKWGEGTVELTNKQDNVYFVKVLTNTDLGNSGVNFIGNEYKITVPYDIENISEAPCYQLYSLNDEPQGIWVTVELVTEAVTAQNSENPSQEEVLFKAGCTSSNVQSLTNMSDSSEVYYTDMFYSLDDNKHELFTDSSCTVSANKFAKFNTVSFPECVHCWEGVVTAPGAKLPWVGVWFEEDLGVRMIYQYEGKEDVRPWNPDKIFGKGNGHKEWGFASVAEEFKDNSFLIETNKNNGNAEWSGELGTVYGQFDMNKFSLVLEKANVQAFTNEEVDEHNAEIQGTVKAGDIKYPNNVLGKYNVENPGNVQIYNV